MIERESGEEPLNELTALVSGQNSRATNVVGTPIRGVAHEQPDNVTPLDEFEDVGAELVVTDLLRCQ
jgi:hypothetical protein